MIIQRKTDGLLLLESDLFRTVTTIIEGNDFLLLVDPNWLPREVEYIAREIEHRRAGKQLYLLFTHSDYDHIIGYERFAGAITIASAAFTSNPDKEKVLTQIREFDDAYYLRRPYAISYPNIDQPVLDGVDTLKLGTETILFFPAPGHNRDGMLTLLPERGILIAGDYLSNIEFPYVYHSISQYRITLGTLGDLIDSGRVGLLITGHGDATDSQEEMQARLRDSHQYLDDLEYAVRNGQPFDTESLFKRYGFPKVMGDFHAGNCARHFCKLYIRASQ